MEGKRCLAEVFGRYQDGVGIEILSGVWRKEEIMAVVFVWIKEGCSLEMVKLKCSLGQQHLEQEVRWEGDLIKGLKEREVFFMLLLQS